jgi:molybdenum cofactor sulfurtransferase
MMEKDEFREFLRKYPGYKNDTLDRIRTTQFPNLGTSTVYVDWTGAAISPNVLLEKHFAFLKENVIGNPHSHHAPSSLAMHEINETREDILRYFHADPAEYEVIFTSNATGAILLLQHYKFEGGELLLTADNHNSVNGLREIAKRKGAVVRYSPITPALSLDDESLMRNLSHPRSTGNKLFAYPAKSNYTGTLHSLDWVNIAQTKGWDVLLDAAAFMANNVLDLSRVKPDFVPVSFYKLFGYPTGIGCLLIKKSKYEKLHKRWFSGGSILLVSVMKDFYAPETVGYARYEDGTVNFAEIPAIKDGLEFLAPLADRGLRATAIASWLHEALHGLKVNGNSIVVHSPKGNDTVTFSVKKGDKIIESWLFERAANEDRICVRSGCFCNPGVNEKIHGYSIKNFEDFYNDTLLPSQMTIEQLQKYSDGKPIGSIRASFGYANTFNDALAFVKFTKRFLANL